MKALVDRYEYRLSWSDENDAFVVRVTEFAGLATHGETADKALESSRKLVRRALAALKRQGHPAPEPLRDQTFSGKLNLRLPPDLHRELAIEAKNKNISLNTVLLNRIIRGGLQMMEAQVTSRASAEE